MPGDIRAVLLLYVSVVAALYLAFQVFTTEQTLGLFLCYAAGLIVGVVGPVIYTVWMRGRPLADLGIALMFAAIWLAHRMAFTVIGAGRLVVDYATQLTFLQSALLLSETEGLSPWTQYNPRCPTAPRIPHRG
jgi:hypothetical protein